MFNIQDGKTLHHAFPPQYKLVNKFAGAVYQFSTVRKQREETVGLSLYMSVTDDVIDWPLPKKSLAELQVN